MTLENFSQKEIFKIKIRIEHLLERWPFTCQSSTGL